MSSQLYLLSVDVDSSSLFEQEVKRKTGSKIVERLTDRQYLCQQGSEDFFYFVQHRFPVLRSIQVEDASLKTLSSLDFEDTLEKFSLQDYAIQLAANRRLDWSFSQLIEIWMERFSWPREKRNNRRPKNILSCFIYLRPEGGAEVYLGTSETKENISSWSQGLCRMPRAKESISRAEQKLEEALESLELHSPKNFKLDGAALDLGAAPGGWSRVLAKLGFQVDAVDPAKLDPRVLNLRTVQHHRTTSGDFLRGRNQQYQALVCDMKMNPDLAAKLLVESSTVLSEAGFLITTLKLGKGKKALSEIDRAMTILRRAYTIVQARQLYFNRREITVLALPICGKA